VQSLIDRVAQIPGVIIADGAEHWVIAVLKTGSLRFEITVPRAALEWFVIAKVGDDEVWRDWADHYAVAGETNTELGLEMQACVENFVNALSRREVRTVSGSGSAGRINVEWWRNEHWEKISLAEA
jgi:hypothetical protein